MKHKKRNSEKGTNACNQLVNPVSGLSDLRGIKVKVYIVISQRPRSVLLRLLQRGLLRPLPVDRVVFVNE